jgi:hypothetical protein
MSDGPRASLLPRVLFCVTLAVAAGLGGMVLASPALDAGGRAAGGWPRLVAVFARDAAVRRTAVAGALGLVVTACVFFRPPALTRRRREARPPRTPPPNHVVGA